MIAEKRIVHPIKSDGPSRDDAGNCQCDWCRHWSPIIHNIGLQLDEEAKRHLDEFVEHHCNMWMDLNVADAKLNGSWPGYGAMKNFTPTSTEE